MRLFKILIFGFPFGSLLMSPKGPNKTGFSNRPKSPPFHDFKNFCPFGRSRLVFMFVFRQPTELTLYIPLFGTDFNQFRWNQAVAGSSHSNSEKRHCTFTEPDATGLKDPFPFFSTQWAFFLYFSCLQKVFLSLFDILILQQTGVSKGLHFYIFRHVSILT